MPAETATNYFRNREALLVDMITESLWGAATVLRDRYPAIFELRLEARRRPALEHVLSTLYGGALFYLVTGPAGGFGKAYVRGLVSTMVHGALNSDEPKAP